mgnify:FL=1
MSNTLHARGDEFSEAPAPLALGEIETLSDDASEAPSPVPLP